MAINYPEITDEEKLEIADLLQQVEAMDDELAGLNTRKAQSQVGWATEEQEFQAEKNRVLQVIRNMRKATVTPGPGPG